MWCDRLCWLPYRVLHPAETVDANLRSGSVRNVTAPVSKLIASQTGTVQNNWRNRTWTFVRCHLCRHTDRWRSSNSETRRVYRRYHRCHRCSRSSKDLFRYANT